MMAPQHATLRFIIGYGESEEDVRVVPFSVLRQLRELMTLQWLTDTTEYLIDDDSDVRIVAVEGVSVGGCFLDVVIRTEGEDDINGFTLLDQWNEQSVWQERLTDDGATNIEGYYFASVHQMRMPDHTVTRSIKVATA